MAQFTLVIVQAMFLHTACHSQIYIHTDICTHTHTHTHTHICTYTYLESQLRESRFNLGWERTARWEESPKESPTRPPQHLLFPTVVAQPVSEKVPSGNKFLIICDELLIFS